MRHVDFIWPVPSADLDAIEVLEAVGVSDDRAVWRPRPRLVEPRRIDPWPAPLLEDLPLIADGFAAPGDPDLVAPPPIAPGPVAAPAHATRTATFERVSLVAVGFLVGAALATVALPERPRPADATPLPRATTETMPPHPAAPASAAEVSHGVRRDAPETETSAAASFAESPVPASHGDDARLEREADPPQRDVRVGPGGQASRGPARRVPTTVQRDRDPTAETTSAVLDSIRRYAAAYSRMDATATRAVWRGVERQQLVQAFTGLREQRLTLRDCVVHTADDAATASCRGTLRYRPRVGEHSTRTRHGGWRFMMQRTGEGWIIESILAP